MPVVRKQSNKVRAKRLILEWCKKHELRVLHDDCELKFHPERKWRFDYAFPDYMIALEVEGGTFSRGRHTRGAGYEKDIEKYNEATIMGWRVIRASTGQVVAKDRIVFQWLERMFAAAGLELGG